MLQQQKSDFYLTWKNSFSTCLPFFHLPMPREIKTAILSGFQLNFRLSSSKGLSKLYLFAVYSLLKCNFVSCAGRQIKTKMKTRRQMDMSVNPKRWHTRSLSGRRANQNPRNSVRFRLFSFQGQMKTALLSCK